MCLFHFLRFRIEQPVYINIIRDPINRFLSNYFFRRFGDWRGEQNHLIRTPRMKDDERYLVSCFSHLSFLYSSSSSPPQSFCTAPCSLFLSSASLIPVFHVRAKPYRDAAGISMVFEELLRRTAFC